MPTNNVPVPAGIRKRVAQRASYICEYCLAHDEGSFIGFEKEQTLPRSIGITIKLCDFSIPELIYGPNTLGYLADLLIL